MLTTFLRRMAPACQRVGLFLSVPAVEGSKLADIYTALTCPAQLLTLLDWCLYEMALKVSPSYHNHAFRGIGGRHQYYSEQGNQWKGRRGLIGGRNRQMGSGPVAEVGNILNPGPYYENRTFSSSCVVLAGPCNSRRSGNPEPFSRFNLVRLQECSSWEPVVSPSP